MIEYNTTPSAPQERHTTRRDERLRGVTWDKAKAHERAILDRVAADLHAQPWWPEHATAIPQPAPKQGYGWLAWAGAMGVCLLLGSLTWALLGPQEPQQDIHRARKLHPMALQPQLPKALEVPAHGSRTLSRKGRWQLRAEGQTRLRLQERGPKRVVIQLERGRIHVAVRPGSMKQFEVRWAGSTRLIVKGTRFTVEQRSSWLRLEVQRGAVALKRQRKAIMVRAQQGARVQRSHVKIHRYKLTPQPLKTLQERLAWLRQQTPRNACLTALDWSERPGLSKLARKELLEQSAYLLQPSRRFACIKRLWLRIHALHISSASDETALAAAAQSCRHGGGKCVTLYRRYLRAYPKGMLREHVLYWLVHELSQQSSQQRREALKLLRRYQRSFPKGQYKRSILQLHQQIHPK